MTKTKSTKRALLMSALSLLLCVSMLVGTTFAWFTDSVQTGSNIIKSGNLDVTMHYMDGKYAPTAEAAEWQDAEGAAIFDYALWEPGYTQVRHIKISNEGSLALKYKLNIIANGTVTDLAKVIDVYYIDPAEKAITDRAQLTEDDWLDTLDKVLENMSSDATTAAGSLAAEEEVIVTIALKMQETAGNEYQNLSIGTDFTVLLMATQDTVEPDSFDETYDENAPKTYSVNGKAYDSAAAALEAAVAGDKVFLSVVNEPIVIDEAIDLTIANTNIVAGEGVNAITVNATATVTVSGLNTVMGGTGADGVYVAEGATLTLTGKGILIAKGNGGTEDRDVKVGGSGIGVDGAIVIKDMAALTAEGYGHHAFGIGGDTASIVIENSTINHAKGGIVQPLCVNDVKYGKSEPEAGAAIGSSEDGAVIDIKNSTVVRADGGSKAAGIGAMYWTGVTVNITDSTVTAYGGNASAGIGGSRVSDSETAEAQAINVNITNSTVTAYGGQFGAGIGSGYDTHCQSAQPVTTVRISGSDITAVGGKYAAGVGTGYHNAALAGEIKDSTVNAVSGEKYYKDTYTLAMDIGFGITDPAREGKQTGSHIVYNGKTITLGTPVQSVSTAADLLALGGVQVKDKTIVLTQDIDLGGASIASIASWYGTLEVIGNGHTISNAVLVPGSHNGMSNYGLFFASTNSTLTVRDLVIEDVVVDATDDATRNYGAAIVVGYTDGDSNVTLDNVDVHNCQVLNDTLDIGDEASVYVGYQTGTLTMVDCDSTGCVVKGETAEKTGAFIGMVNGTATVTNCTTDLTIGACNRVGADASLTIN